MSEDQVQHWRVTYNDIHNLIRGVTPQLAKDFNPDLMVAIGAQISLLMSAPRSTLTSSPAFTGGGGFFPARVMRTFLREITENKSLQIQAIGLSLYEPLPGTSQEMIGKEVVRTQWMKEDPHRRKIPSIALRSTVPLNHTHHAPQDEVDDTRKTLGYALSELKKDVAEELLKHPESERAALAAATQFAIFVVHNKNKPKLAELPEGTPYYAGEEVEDVWLDYPWEAINIEEHDRLAAQDRKAVA
ncbi:hypothetical protein H0H87_011241 [Tephrocybe sp. NHM501043]|nr:hypothetical protein H0H87_011241 [Tephrocybe sp. NHM501043]